MFWLANRINSWFHEGMMWKTYVLLSFTLGLFVIPLTIDMIFHISGFKIYAVLSSLLAMVLNTFLIVYVRNICYNMKDKMVKKHFHEKWLRTPGGGFIYFSLMGQSDNSFNLIYHRAWNIEEIVYYPCKEELKHYEKIEVHPFQLFPLWPASKKDIAKYDLDVKLAKAFLDGAERDGKPY
jgi:hypothetical protein